MIRRGCCRISYSDGGTSSGGIDGVSGGGSGTSTGDPGRMSGGTFCGGTSVGLPGGISGFPLFIVLSPSIGIAFIASE